MRLPSTRIWSVWWIRHTNLLSRVEIFEYVMAGSGIVWTLNSDISSGDVTRSRQFFNVNTVFVLKMATSFPGFLCYPPYDACSVATISRRVLRTGSRGDVFVVRTSKSVENIWKNGLFWSRWRSRNSFVTDSLYPKPRDWRLARSAYSIHKDPIGLINRAKRQV